MKNLLTVSTLVAMFTLNVSSAALERLSTTSITFYNFSLNAYDLTNHELSVGMNWHTLSSLSVLSGNLNLNPSESVTVGVTVPNSTGSVGLWQPGTNGSSASMSNIVDYVQYGAGGQAYESIAVQAYLTAAGVFAPGNLPIVRTDANTGPGNGNWVEETTGIFTLNGNSSFEIFPSPFVNELNITANTTEFSVSDGYTVGIYDVAGKLWLSLDAKDTGRMTIDAALLPKGMYVVKINSAGGPLISQRIVKH